MPFKQLDAATIAKKWSQNLSNSVQQIQTSVQALQNNPAAAAAAAGATWQARMADPATLAKWQKGLNRVTLQSWKDAMLQKGIPRIAQGANQAVPKFTQFLQAFLPFEQNVQAQVAAMPKGTLQDRINRMIAMVQGLTQFPGY